MFGKSFKLVFGIGAGVIATLSLGAAAIGIFWGVAYMIDDPRRRVSDQLVMLETRFEAVMRECPALVDEAVSQGTVSTNPPMGGIPALPAGATELEEARHDARRLARMVVRKSAVIELMRRGCEAALAN